jgi:hypothetical protein
MISSKIRSFPADVVSFNVDIGRLVWSARELRKTNDQDHLLPIKKITRCLKSRMSAFEVQFSTLIDSQNELVRHCLSIQGSLR